MRKNVSILLIVLCILIIFTLILFAEEAKFDFRETTWGMNETQVELAEKGKIEYKRDREGYTEYELTYKVKFGLYNYYCYYYFVEDKLYKCEYRDAETIFDSSGFIAITEYKRFKKALIEKYGKPFSQDERNAYVSYSSSWDTPTTKIKLYYGSLFNSLSITYESKELKKWADKILEEKTKIIF